MKSLLPVQYGLITAMAVGIFSFSLQAGFFNKDKEKDKGKGKKADEAQSLDWPRFRGPNGDSISLDTNWDEAKLAAPKIAWNVNVGIGYSGVSVKGDFVYTMGNKDGKDTVYCLKASDGSEVWKYAYDCKSVDHPGTRSTPTIDGDKVYTLSNEIGRAHV
jgi:hypothetical protein